VSFSCGYSAASTGTLDGSASTCGALTNRSGLGNGSTRTAYIQIGGSLGSGDTSSRIPGTYTGNLVFVVNAVY
jgi:hypothetical protein